MGNGERIYFLKHKKINGWEIYGIWLYLILWDEYVFIGIRYLWRKDNGREESLFVWKQKEMGKKQGGTRVKNRGKEEERIVLPSFLPLSHLLLLSLTYSLHHLLPTPPSSRRKHLFFQSFDPLVVTLMFCMSHHVDLDIRNVTLDKGDVCLQYI